MKRRVVRLEEAQQGKRIHPLDLEDLARVTGGATTSPSLPTEPTLPPPILPATRDWGWWP